jgi:hypothetical protein
LYNLREIRSLLIPIEAYFKRKNFAAYIVVNLKLRMLFRDLFMDQFSQYFGFGP